MMNLVIDVGNTRMKYAFFVRGGIVEYGYGKKALKDALDRQAGKGMNGIVSGSGDLAILQDLGLENRCTRLLHFSNAMALKLPMEIRYASLLTLGTDRIADVAGASALFPGRDLLVIDAGSAITCDYYLAEGRFAGGNISPGVGMRFRSLHDYTEALPLLEGVEDTDISDCGQDTVSAIRKGVMRGVYSELSGYIHEFLGKTDKGIVVFTGGDNWLAKRYGPEKIVTEPHLSLKGLDVILEYNL